MDKVYGYVRVSSMEQNEDRQMVALKKEGVAIGHIFMDKQSGKDFHRENYEKLVLQILSFVAENERENIRKRQEQGIAAAKKRGVRFGRPETKVPGDFKKIVRAWEQGNIRLAEVLDRCQMSKSTFYRKLRKMRLKQGE